MLGVFVLPLVVLGAYFVVVTAAAAYELTGLDRETARFQALSAFTGTGFTTRVSELVVSHPLRRRITSALIITGYAGTATVVASLVTSIEEQATGTILNLTVMGLMALATWAVLWRLGPNVMGDVIRRYLAPRLTGDRVPHEELLLYKKGYGLARVEVPRRSRVCGRSLRELDLRASRIQILAVEEGEDVHPIPDPDWAFTSGQHLLVYGDLRRLQEAFGPEDA